jgi:hypothetical protein
MFWPKAIFTLGAVDDVNMAFGQTIPIASHSWGDAPGYGENRPSATRFVANAQLQNLRVGLVLTLPDGHPTGYLRKNNARIFPTMAVLYCQIGSHGGRW